jgi:predicted nucleic acid-binding protein
LTVLADTGALYALVNRSDAWHERVRAWWEVNREPIRVPVTVIPEVTYLIATRLGSSHEAAFVRGLSAGEVEIEPLVPEDVTRGADLLETYADLPLGFVDASIVAMAERLDVATLVTTDRRHFAVVRPAHVPRLRLVP